MGDATVFSVAKTKQNYTNQNIHVTCTQAHRPDTRTTQVIHLPTAVKNCNPSKCNFSFNQFEKKDGAWYDATVLD